MVRLLGSRPLHRLGEWSYSFYLLHAAIYIGVGALLREVAPQLLEHKEQLLPVVAVCFVLSTIGGALMHRWVEVPAQRALLRRWIPRVRS